TDVSVPATPYREETRIVPVALLEQDVERPLAAADDREARRPEAHDLGAGLLLHDRLRATNGRAERVRRLVRDPHVVPGMRRELVTGRDDPPHQFRLALGEPPDGEERRACIESRQEVQQSI